MFFSDRSLFSELEKIYSNSAWLLIAKQMYQSFYEMKKKFFFASDTQKASISMYDPYNAMCAIMCIVQCM